MLGWENLYFKYSMDGVSLEEFKEERDCSVTVKESFKCRKLCGKAAASVLGIIKKTFANRDNLCEFDGKNFISISVKRRLYLSTKALPDSREIVGVESKCDRESSNLTNLFMLAIALSSRKKQEGNYKEA